MEDTSAGGLIQLLSVNIGSQWPTQLARLSVTTLALTNVTDAVFPFPSDLPNTATIANLQLTNFNFSGSSIPSQIGRLSR